MDCSDVRVTCLYPQCENLDFNQFFSCPYCEKIDFIFDDNEEVTK